MNESELVKFQFYGLGIWMGLVLPAVVGGIMWGWSVVREKWALWRAGRGRGG
jgi:hypothetical protein